MKKLTQSELKTRLHYDPETGAFTWLVVHSNAKKPGERAGYNPKKSYAQIRIDGKLYAAHALAWLYMTGEWPKGEIDHKNRDKSDNSWGNLRDVTRSQNNGNHDKRKDNSTGFRGVSWSERDKYFHAYINKDGKRINIGYYQDKLEAARAYDKKAKELFGDCAYQNLKDA